MTQSPPNTSITGQTPDDPKALRNAFGAFMTGVTVVTAQDDAGQPIGFTANSFTSVSLNPPLLLVCVAKSSAHCDTWTKVSGFAVNILGENQTDISNTFARPVEDRFADVDWGVGPFGAPVLKDVSAWFDCAMHETVDAGDHVILIGKVEAFDTTPTPGLGYVRGSYVTARMGSDAVGAKTDLVVSALIERDGAVLMVGDDRGGMALPQTRVRPTEGATAAIERLLRDTGLPAKAGFIYSVFEDVGRQLQHIAFLCNAGSGTPVKGTFVPLQADALDDISDPALLTMLERFLAESEVGQFGIYYGTQNSGEVRTLT